MRWSETASSIPPASSQPAKKKWTGRISCEAINLESFLKSVGNALHDIFHHFCAPTSQCFPIPLQSLRSVSVLGPGDIDGRVKSLRFGYAEGFDNTQCGSIER